MAYSYHDHVNFVLWQLDHYNALCSLRQKSEIIGCSVTTINKYDKLGLDYGYWRGLSSDLIKILQDFPFKDNQIKTLIDQDANLLYYVDKQHDVYSKKKEPKQPAPLVQDITQFDLKIKGAFNTNYSHKYPQQPGLYMMAQIICHPTQINTRYFLIKIGMSTTNLNQRINSYKGMNPFAACVDYQIIYKDVRHYENIWHHKMDTRYERQGNSEWYIVPFEDYTNFLQYGFNYKI